MVKINDTHDDYCEKTGKKQIEMNDSSEFAIKLYRNYISRDSTNHFLIDLKKTSLSNLKIAGHNPTRDPIQKSIHVLAFYRGVRILQIINNFLVQLYPFPCLLGQNVRQKMIQIIGSHFYPRLSSARLKENLIFNRRFTFTTAFWFFRRAKPLKIPSGPSEQHYSETISRRKLFLLSEQYFIYVSVMNMFRLRLSSRAADECQSTIRCEDSYSDEEQLNVRTKCCEILEQSTTTSQNRK